MARGEQLRLRGDGKPPVIRIAAENLAEATQKSIIACHDSGLRIETPKQTKGMTLGYDADMDIIVNNPDSEPKIYFPGMHDTGEGVMQYILELTHGIHNHWKKTPEEPNFWGYTYNERFAPQLPFIFQRIKADWEDKKKKEGKGRITGRDYQFSIWIAGEDIILEQEDPPCWQRGNLRFAENNKGKIVMNYITEWRSRDLLKAWNENNVAQVKLMRLLAMKVSSIIGEEVKLGAYIDRSSSLHLYGLYIDRDGLEKQMERIKYEPYKEVSRSLDDYFMEMSGKNETQLKRLIAAQSDAERRGHGKNVPESGLIELGYNLDTFVYPEEWDTWPDSWNEKPDVNKLARVYKK